MLIKINGDETVVIVILLVCEMKFSFLLPVCGLILQQNCNQTVLGLLSAVTIWGKFCML